MSAFGGKADISQRLPNKRNLYEYSFGLSWWTSTIQVARADGREVPAHLAEGAAYLCY